MGERERYGELGFTFARSRSTAFGVPGNTRVSVIRNRAGTPVFALVTASVLKRTGRTQSFSTVLKAVSRMGRGREGRGAGRLVARVDRLVGRDELSRKCMWFLVHALRMRPCTVVSAMVSR